MASPSFLGCPLKLNDAEGRSLSSVLSDKCTVNRMMRDPDLPTSLRQSWKRMEGSGRGRAGGKGTTGAAERDVRRTKAKQTRRVKKVGWKAEMRGIRIT